MNPYIVFRLEILLDEIIADIKMGWIQIVLLDTEILLHRVELVEFDRVKWFYDTIQDIQENKS